VMQVDTCSGLFAVRIFQINNGVNVGTRVMLHFDLGIPTALFGACLKKERGPLGNLICLGRYGFNHGSRVGDAITRGPLATVR
jgi:hypothetical protein